jgi:hypothetical protein
MSSNAEISDDAWKGKGGRRLVLPQRPKTCPAYKLLSMLDLPLGLELVVEELAELALRSPSQRQELRD